MNHQHRRFRIIVAENSHYQDPNHHYEVDGADTAAEAILKCQAIVDTCLHELAQGGRSADKIIADYRLYGEDPFIIPPSGEQVSFSAWTYADERAAATLSRPESRNENDRFLPSN